MTPNPLGKDRQQARFATLQFDLLPDCHEHAHCSTIASKLISTTRPTDDDGY